MTTAIVFFYGALCHLVFFATLLYAVGFLGNLVVPKSIDSGISGRFTNALLINVVLLAPFVAQHAGMTRPQFKRWLKGVVPEPTRRSAFVLLNCLLLLLLFRYWRPMVGMIWSVENANGRLLVWLLFSIGWATAIACVFLLNRLDLFGLHSVSQHVRRTESPLSNLTSRASSRRLRHVAMVAAISALWATPRMTVGHLLFATVTTGYLLVAVHPGASDIWISDESAVSESRVPMLSR
jgi:methanethiol S-methyltransferase